MQLALKELAQTVCKTDNASKRAGPSTLQHQWVPQSWRVEISFPEERQTPRVARELQAHNEMILPMLGKVMESVGGEQIDLVVGEGRLHQPVLGGVQKRVVDG